MTKIKGLTEDYEGEFRLKAAKGREMLRRRRERVLKLRDERAAIQNRIEIIQNEILTIGNMDVEELEL